MTRYTFVWVSLGSAIAVALGGCVAGDFEDGEDWPGDFDVAGAEEPIVDGAEGLTDDEGVIAVGFHCVGTLAGLDCVNEGDSHYAHRIIGGQGRNVELSSEEPDLDPSDLDEWPDEDGGGGTATADVKVENLMEETLGGEEGFEVFFVQEPAVVEGAEDVSIAIQDEDGNAVDRGTFSGTDQPFFRYEAELEQGDTAEKAWQFEFSGMDGDVDASDIIYEFAVLLHSEPDDDDEVALTFTTEESGEFELDIEMHDGFENVATWEIYDTEGELDTTYEDVDEIEHDFGGVEGEKTFIVYVDPDAPQELLWSGSNLVGEIPVELGELTEVEVISFKNGDLEGDFHAELGNLVNLERFILTNNNLSGALPAEFGDMESLEVISFQSNDFEETLPSEIGQLQNLRSLNLRFNDIESPLPEAIGELENLEVLLLESNELDSISEQLSNLGALERLNLANNDITGDIPSSFADLQALTELRVDRNAIDGYQEGAFATQPNLADMRLQRNQLGTAEVDQILEDCVESLDVEDRVTADLDLSGGDNEAPSEDGEDDIDTLESAEWDVTAVGHGDD